VTGECLRGVYHGGAVDLYLAVRLGDQQGVLLCADSGISRLEGE